MSTLKKLLRMTTQNKRRRLQAIAVQILLGIAGLALFSFACFQLGFGLARTGFAYVIVIALVSLLGSFSASIVLSIVAAACLNFFFAPPFYEFRIDIPDDIERIATFLTTSLVVTALVTKVKRSADELRENQAKWVKAERVAHFGWWERDFTTNHVSLSDEVSRIFGVRPVDLPDWHERWLELILPEDRARAAEAAAAALVPGGPRYDLEYRLLRPDGTERVVRSQGDFAWDNSGLPMRQFGVMQDITELRHAEHELRASETRFRTLVDHASDAFFLYNEDATVLDVNRQACENLGYRRDELIGMTAFDYGPDLTPVLLQRIRERLRDGKIVTYDGRHRRKDGTVFPVEVRIRPLWREGQLLAVSLDRDITERKRAEDELRASEERFRTFADYAADAFFLFDDHAAILDVNRQACESLGYSREELIGKHVSGFDVGLDEVSIERLRERMLDGETVTFETRHMCKDGTSFPVEVRGGQFEQGGRRYLSLARDISERKRAEEALLRSEAYLAEAQRLSHTGTSVYNVRGNLYWSDECYRIWEFDPLQGLPDADTVWQRIHPDDRDRVREENQKALHESGEHSVEFRIFCCDGSIKYIEATFHPLRSSQGGIDEIVCTHVDVTERRRAQAQAEELLQLEADLAHMNRLGIMGELTASLAHEILHPIATVRNNARSGMRLLEMSPPNLGEVKEVLGCVVRDADRAKDIVGRIRDHIKKASPQREIVDLDEAIDEVIVMVRAAMDRNRVSVRTRPLEHKACVRGDRVQLQQVMLNLILNAVEAMSSVGEGTRELSIITERDEADGILVAVRDSGPGIEPELRNRIFEPFYTTKNSGIGMGLSICRSIIDAHGGRLWTDADQPRGAVFRFTLPAVDESSDISSSTCLETLPAPEGVECPKQQPLTEVRSTRTRGLGVWESHMNRMNSGQNRRAASVFGALLLAATSVFAIVGPATPARAEVREKWCKGVHLRFFVGGAEGDSFATVVYNGAKQAERDFGPKVDYIFSGWDVEKMIQQLREATAVKPDGIAMMGHPGDAAIMPLAEEAASAGIKMMYQNVPVPKVIAKFGGGYVGAQVAQLGRALGVEVVKRAGLKPGDVAFMQGPFDNENRGARERGTVAAMEEAGVKVIKINSQPGWAADPNLALPVITAALAKYPEVKAIGYGGGQMLGNVPVFMQTAGKKPGEVFNFGVDTSPQVVEGFKGGWVQLAADQQPFLQGYLPILGLCQQIVYRFTPISVDTGAGFVTPDNYGEVAKLATEGVR